MRSVIRLTSMGFLLALLAGCSSPGMLAFRQVGDALPALGTAPGDGSYGLFIAGQEQPLYEIPLKKDQPLGFARGEVGPVRMLYAVAGTTRMPLDISQTYEWRLELTDK